MLRIAVFLTSLCFHPLQYDRHLPVLTVAETFEFAHACCGRRADWVSKEELDNA